MLLDIVVILALIILNGLFAMSELAIVSAKPVRLQERADGGDQGAAKALELARAPDRFLSTVQAGITLIGILAGAVGGATLTTDLAEVLSTLSIPAHYSQQISFIIIVGSITFISIVAGELVPKTLALAHAEAIASAVSRPLYLFSRIMTPVVALLSWSNRTLVSAIGVPPSTMPQITAEEIKILIEQGAEAGVLEAEEEQMAKRVMKLGDRSISLLMTQRQDVIWVDAAGDPRENLRIIAESGHSYVPVCNSSLDSILGVVRVREIVRRLVNNEEIDLQKMLTPPLYVPDNLSALRVLERFKETGIHIAMVLDEYGSFEGLVTLNDVLLTIVGDMHTLDDEGEPAVVERDDGSLLIDGRYPIDEMLELLRLSELPEDEQGNYETVAGFVMTRLGRIPHMGDRFAWREHTFEVIDMDGKRVDRILVTVPIAPESDAQESSDQ